MRSPATTQFLAAVDPFRKIIKVARKNRYSLSSHPQYAPKARTALATLRKNFLVMKRDYPEERYPRVAFQIASIEPLIVRLTETFPDDPRSMLQLLDEVSFKAESDLAAELDALDAQVGTQAPSVPFLPDDLIENRFGVMQKVLWEANQCYERGCYNACAAMIRRLVESLIVECYERHGNADRIKKNGEYLEFGALIGKASNEPVLKLTRNTKRILPDLKFFGDIGAHNRMMLVKKADLDRVHQSIRSGIEELARNL